MMETIKRMFMPKALKAETPSILKQTDLKVGFFNFGGAEKVGVDYFNCGLVRRPDGLWLITRRSRSRKGLSFGFNDLVAFLLDEKTHRPLRGSLIKMQQRWPDEQWEDARAVYHQGRTFISCCDFIWNRGSWTGAHQIVEEVGDGWQSLQRYDPIYGHNQNNLGQNRWHEKNWLWFVHDGAWHLIYKADPHTVAKFNNSFELMDEWVTEPEIVWEYGEIRGGTPPVRVGDYYWTFFHSSTPWKTPRRQYHLGAYAFEAKPPFRVTRISTFPILSGSEEDGGGEKKPACIFAVGSELRDGTWLVTGGCNDIKCFWLEIPHSQLLKMTAEI